MKAVVFEKYGNPDVLEVREVAKPTPKPDEVLIKVQAASVNSWDWELLRGTPFANRMMFGLLRPKKINILGCDIAGRVEAVGVEVKQFQPGDEVFGDLSGGGWGGFTEYVCARESELALKPAGMSFEQAASIPQAGLLALQGLDYNGPIEPGQKILMNGAGGGVGSFAIQIAKSRGAEVTGVDHTLKLDVMRSVGADHVIDYTKEDFTRSGKQYDLILDVAGYRSTFDYKRALSPKGAYAMIGGAMTRVFQILFLGRWFSMTENKKMGLLLHKPNKGLATMSELFEAGKIIPVIDRRYPLSEVADALRYFGEGRVKGKIIITQEQNDKA